jgi:acetyl-CoA acetyltransferase
VWQATYAAQQRALNPTGPNPYGTAPKEPRVGGGLPSYTAPSGIGSPANTLAMIASNHFKRYGTTRHTLGWIAINQRNNAALNPAAVYREPLTMDDYLSARLISTPFGLYDCDVPVDASIAVVLSHRDTAEDLRRTPVYIEAAGTAMTERTISYQSTMSHEPQVLGPCAHLWSRTTLRPRDVDVALLYDGFTFNCLSWLEGLGFCAVGEARDFLDGGANIGRDGVIPVNPHGGQLSAGRTHGMGLVHEAVLQLRGQAGERQIRDARVAAVCSGGLSPAGVFLFRNG